MWDTITTPTQPHPQQSSDSHTHSWPHPHRNSLDCDSISLSCCTHFSQPCLPKGQVRLYNMADNPMQCLDHTTLTLNAPTDDVSTSNQSCSQTISFQLSADFIRQSQKCVSLGRARSPSMMKVNYREQNLGKYHSLGALDFSSHSLHSQCPLTCRNRFRGDKMREGR